MKLTIKLTEDQFVTLLESVRSSKDTLSNYLDAFPGPHEIPPKLRTCIMLDLQGLEEIQQILTKGGKIKK